MLTKESLQFNIYASPQLKQWLPLFEANKRQIVTSNKFKLNISLISLDDLKSFSKNKINNPFSIALIFYDDSLPLIKILSYIKNAAYFFIPNSANKLDKEKFLKSIIKEIFEPCILINPFDIESILDTSNQSPLILHLNQIAKKIYNSNDTICLLEEDKSSYGLGYLLFMILKKTYIPYLQFVQYSPSNSDFIFSPNSKYFIQFQGNYFLQFAKNNNLPKNSIIHIYNVSQKDFLEKYNICSTRNILLPQFQEFQNSLSTIIDFISHLTLDNQIMLTEKAFETINKKSYSLRIINLENLFKKINSSNSHLITENIIMTFMEGGKKNINHNFSHYFTQVLISNAPKWKSGNIYDSGKALLEKILIQNALEICHNHKKNAAKILGINRNSLREKKNYIK